jgi:hypothetical protein
MDGIGAQLSNCNPQVRPLGAQARLFRGIINAMAMAFLTIVVARLDGLIAWNVLEPVSASIQIADRMFGPTTCDEETLQEAFDNLSEKTSRTGSKV